jgi:hypothetical protein
MIEIPLRRPEGAFHCPYCNIALFTEEQRQDHIDFDCNLNPSNRCCNTCRFGKEARIDGRCEIVDEFVKSWRSECEGWKLENKK